MPLNGVKSIWRTSPSMTFQSGLFFFSVLHADVSNSLRSTWWNPARDMPRARPPPPANNSIELNWRRGVTSASSSQRLSSIDFISGIALRFSMSKPFMPFSTFRGYNPFLPHACTVWLEVPMRAAKLFSDINVI